jgi:4-amino-4-deoxy-L-arabinose transferase-like glycosyltransferase
MKSTADSPRAGENSDAGLGSSAQVRADESGRASTVEVFGRTVSWHAAQAVVLVLAGLMFFVRLGARALWSSEFRWAEIAREMLLTSHYFWPTINGRVYYDKPLGSYWLVLAATWLTGGLNEAAARLPSAIAGLLSVWLLILIARRLYDRRTALLAGAVLATCFSFVFFSRLACADVETIAGELAALLLFLRYEDRQDGWWVVGLWVVMALTSLTKGLLGFVLPLMVIGLYSLLGEGWAELWRRISQGPVFQRIGWLIQRNRWFFNWKSIIAVVLGAAIYYVPFMISFAHTGSDTGLREVYRENVVRYFHPFDHRGSIYLYVYVIFALMMPWSAFLPAALAEAHRKGGPPEVTARSNRFALVFFWGTFIFFTLSGSRRSYYLLPILPAGAMLVARMLTTSTRALSTLARGLMKAGFAVIAVGVIGGVIVMLPPAWILPGRLATLPVAPHRMIYGICWAISVAAVLYALRRLGTRRVAASTLTVGALLLAYVYIVATPAADKWRGERAFAMAIRHDMGAATTGVVLYKAEGPIYYLGLSHPVPYYDKVSELRKAALADKIHWVIVRRRDLTELESSIGISAKVVAHEAFYPFQSRGHIRNLNVLIALEPGAKAAPTTASASQRR